MARLRHAAIAGDVVSRDCAEARHCQASNQQSGGVGDGVAVEGRESLAKLRSRCQSSVL